MEKDIGKISKGEYQGTITNIIIGIREYNGKVGVDIREFVESDKYNGPTKKGLRIPAEHFETFKKMINSIDESDLKVGEKSGETQTSQGTLDKVKTEKPGQGELPDY